MARVFRWDEGKNRKLVKERGISFEAVVAHIEAEAVAAIVRGRGKYGHQKQYLVVINNYIYIVPFVEDDEQIFLKTIIPSRKMTKLYLSGGL